MSLFRRLIPILGAGGAGKPEVVFPMEYVFTEGTAADYDVMYDNLEGAGPVSIAQSEDSYATLRNAQRKLARLSDGTLYAVYNKQLAGKHQIYVKKSVDEGVTWTDETRISTYAGMESYDQFVSAIAVDSSDHLHVVWRGSATGYATYYQMWHAEYTDSWQDPVRISTFTDMESGYQYDPAIAVDSINHLHVVWRGRTPVYGTSSQIWYAEYTDSWQTPIRISTYTDMEDAGQIDPAIAVDGIDHIHVVWHGQAPYEYIATQIWHAEGVSPYAAEDWVTPVRINVSADMVLYNQSYPSLTIDSSDNLHVVWHGNKEAYTYAQIWYAKGVSPYATINWAEPVRISTYAGMEGKNQSYPSIAVDSSDHLHVLWYGMATGYTDKNKVWYAEYTDAWQAPTCLQPTGQNQHPNLRWSRWP